MNTFANTNRLFPSKIMILTADFNEKLEHFYEMPNVTNRMSTNNSVKGDL